MFFKEIAVDRYLPNINPEISLYEQPLLPETKQILGMLYCYYWSKEDEVKDIPDKVINEAKEVKNELFENYSPEDIFEGAKKRRENSLETGKPTEFQEKIPWYKKLFK